MRTFVIAGVLAALVAACDGSSSSLPSGDGYGPLGNGSPATGAAPPPSSAPTATSPPTSAPPPPPSSWSDAGWQDSGWSDASGGTGWEAGGEDAGGWPDSGGWTTDSGTPSPPSTLLSLCVGEINELRNQNGAFPYIESSALEAFAAQAASSDAQALQFHGYFNQTGGGGIAFGEDEFDGGQIDPGGTAQQVLQQGLLDDEQNQNGGFDNLVTDQYSEVGCGFAQDSIGNWWVTIELR